ncbi:MAG: CRISPR-associated protein Cas4 [Desulfotomaculales bacterium]
MTAQEEPRITGSLVQSYLVCARQAWLMSRQICPDEDHVYLELGRLVQQQTYARERKEVTMGHLKLDLLRRGNKELVVGEVKKSSRAVEAARMQLAFYLYELREMGVEAEGELLFPEERQKEILVLDEHWVARVRETKARLAELLRREVPPRAERTGFCRRCAYAEFCWA